MNAPSRSLVLHSWYSYTSAVLIISIMAWALGLPGFLLRAEASQVSNLTDIISTSKPGIASDHTIQFDTPTGVPADDSTIEITIPAGFDMSFIGEDDIDITDNGTDLTTAATCGAVQAAVSTSSQAITITICNGGGGAIVAGHTVAIEIGENATASGVGVNQIVNHGTVGSYEVLIGGTMADEGVTRVVIIESVTVTGSVDTYFDFQILGVDAGLSVNTEATFATTTATSVPFGALQSDTEYVLAQDLEVTTNAKSGFTVAVFADGELRSTGGATINSFTDGTGTSTPIAWVAPSAQTSFADTYGHWGLTTEDITLSDDDSFGDALYAGDFISTPREIMYSTSSADGSTAHIGTTRVGYKMEISALQEAAAEYSTRLIYVATPIF